MPEPGPTPTAAPEVDQPLPHGFDDLTFAEKVAIQVPFGAKEVRVSRVQDDGSEEELFPALPAATFDTGHIAAQHGPGRYKGFIFKARGRRMAGTTTFTIGAAAQPATPAGSTVATDPALTAQLTALREELAQIKEAAGKRRTIADMTPDELRATLQPAQPAAGLNIRDIVTALPAIVPVVKMLLPKSSLSEALTVVKEMQSMAGGAKEPRAEKKSDLEQLTDFLEGPTVQGIIHKFMEGRETPATPAAQQQLPAPKPAAQTTAQASPQTEQAAPATTQTVDAMKDETTAMIVRIAARKLALGLKEKPNTTPDEAAAAVLNETKIEDLRELIGKFPTYQLAYALQQIEPLHAGNERLMWLLMLESALRLAARAEPEQPGEEGDDEE